MSIGRSGTTALYSTCTSSTRPTGPTQGMMIYETDTNEVLFYTGSDWASIGTIGDGSMAPTGTVNPFAGSSSPGGWLLCDGSAVSRTTYAALFAVVSTTYGSGDGSTTFNVPDLRGRAAAGKDNMGGSSANRITSGGAGFDGNALGAAGGTQTHTLTIGEMPSHSHGGGGKSVSYQAGSTFFWNLGSQVAYSTFSMVAEGGGGAHQNTQPTIILNYIIKT